jgi:hypothetical protein
MGVDLDGFFLFGNCSLEVVVRHHFSRLDSHTDLKQLTRLALILHDAASWLGSTLQSCWLRRHVPIRETVSVWNTWVFVSRKGSGSLLIYKPASELGSRTGRVGRCFFLGRTSVSWLMLCDYRSIYPWNSPPALLRR